MSLRANVIANYVGQSWTALMGLAFLPLYARVLGMEAYGLIGVFAVLQAWMTMMDLGLTPTVTREMSRLRIGVRSGESIRDLLRSLEVLWAGLACVIVITGFLSSGWLAHTWLKPRGLPQTVIRQSIDIIGFVLATRWLEQIYRGALQGLQDLIWLNSAQVILATARWGGAYLLILGNPSITVFFVWQGAISFLTAGVLIWRTYRELPKTKRRATFSLEVLLDVRQFAGGMFVGALLSFLLMQTDKIMISRFLPLDALGAYTLASSAASGLLLLMSPMNIAVYPRLNELFAKGEYTELANIYQRACEWMAALIVPPAFVLTFFPQPTLLMWTGNLQLAWSVAPLLAVLALGTLCNGFMNLPYYLQLAYGWTSLAVRINIVAVAIFIPAMFWAVPHFGTIGAAYLWLLLNICYLLTMTHLMHRRALPAAKGRWFRTAVLLPLTVGTIIAVLLRFLAPTVTDRLTAAVLVITVAAVLTLAMLSSLPVVRHDVVGFVRRRMRVLKIGYR